MELYLWQKNLFAVVSDEGTRVWLRVREEDIGLDPLPHCGRIDVYVAGSSLRIEARWLRLITVQMDKVSKGLCLNLGALCHLQLKVLATLRPIFLS